MPSWRWRRPSAASSVVGKKVAREKKEEDDGTSGKRTRRYAWRSSPSRPQKCECPSEDLSDKRWLRGLVITISCVVVSTCGPTLTWVSYLSHLSDGLIWLFFFFFFLRLFLIFWGLFVPFSVSKEKTFSAREQQEEEGAHLRTKLHLAHERRK